MNYRHFSCYTGGSKFIELTEQEKRAVEIQANIDVEAHKLSKYYAHVLKDEETEIGLFNMICEEYSRKSKEQLEQLVRFDSETLYRYPLQKHREKYYQSLAKERCKRMDEEIYIQTHTHYKNYKDTGR